MTIAETLKAYHTSTPSYWTGWQASTKIDVYALTVEAERIGTSIQDWENDSTEYLFADGSVLIVCGPDVSVYGAR